MYETQGNITHIIPPKGYHVEYSNGIASLVSDTPASPLMDTVTQWASDRSKETSTKVGVIAGGAMAPTIIDNVGKAVMFGLAGDYVSCAMFGVPAILGIAGSVGAIFKPDSKTKGLTDVQIKTIVESATREQLIGLLGNSTATTTKPVSEVGLQPSTIHSADWFRNPDNGTVANVGDIKN
jgi:hypothetical protein